MKIAIIGTGFVGVVTAAVYASFDHEVIGLDIDEKKVSLLRNSIVPFYEPGLTDLLSTQQKKGNLTFTTDYSTAISGADIVVIAVGTPSTSEGEADLRYVFAAGESMAPFLKEQAIVVVKSTVPPGTLPKVQEKIAGKTTVSFATASVPEFLKEGTAVSDTLHPDRIVIGATEEWVITALKELHAPLQAPIVVVSPVSAQMAKYTANAYLATRITFINQIADLCETTGADISEIIEAIGHDKRIGSHYWYPGFGYGGSCFPKDVKEIAAYSRSVGLGTNLFNKIDELNEHRPERVLTQFAKKVGGWSDKKVAVLGLSFKPHTNDMREAPSLKVVPALLAAGARVVGYDPEANEVAEQTLAAHDNLSFVSSIAQAITSADVVIALIEWPEITGYAFSNTDTSKTVWFIDARNQFASETIRKSGFEYLGIGRG